MKDTNRSTYSWGRTSLNLHWAHKYRERERASPNRRLIEFVVHVSQKISKFFIALHALNVSIKCKTFLHQRWTNCKFAFDEQSLSQWELTAKRSGGRQTNSVKHDDAKLTATLFWRFVAASRRKTFNPHLQRGKNFVFHSTKSSGFHSASGFSLGIGFN